MTLVDSLSRGLERSSGRRSFLRRMTMWGAALVTAPSAFILTPTTAYGAVCRCSNQDCECNSKCCGGYTEFCCTITGENACPPGGIIGGWWKVDGSEFCGGQARYYMDCHDPCGSCSCGSSGVCSGSCNGTQCSCANEDCRNRKAGCIHFRYGNCNNSTNCLGPIICRVVTCTTPWQIDPGCNTSVRIDNATRYHDSPCLHTAVDPRGFVDSVSAVPGRINARGWALDLDAPDTSPVVRIYLDGKFAYGGRTSLIRRDVQSVFGTATARLGFDVDVDARPGTRRVCVYAINIGGGQNKLIGCRTINVPVANPVGNLEIIETAESGVRVRGWAFDRTAGNPSVTIQVRAGSTVLDSFVADRRRPDVTAAFGLSDDRYGFDEIIPPVDGTATYCVRALDVGDDGSNIDLGCRTFSFDRDPTGWLDGVDLVQGEVKVRGWAFDPDSSNQIAVHVYADSTFIGGGKADEYRPDVGRARGVGDYHGFDFQFGVPANARTVRAYAINVGPGRNTLIGSRDL